MTENIFPYELPENWHWSTLADVASVKGGKRLPAGKKFSEIKTAYPYIRVIDFENLSVNLSDLHYIDYDTHNLIRRYIIFHSDIYISIAGSIGKVGIIPETLNGANLTENAAKITELKNINQKFLVFFLSSDTAQTQIKYLTISTTQPKLALFRIKKILIPVPPLDEQKRIVAIIESLFGKLDAAKSIVQKILDGYELRRAAILHKVFTGELTKNFRADSGLTLDDWQQKKLGDVLELSKEKTNSFNENLKYVGLENIEKDSGTINFQSAKDVKSTKNIFHGGDLLYGKLRPYLNKHGIPNFDGVCSTDILVLSANELSANEFINYFFSLPMFVEYAVSNSRGINLPRVSAKTILNSEINLPPLTEQKEIVRVLAGLLDKEQRTKEFAEKILSEIDLLKRTILARAFRGELLTKFMI